MCNNDVPIMTENEKVAAAVEKALHDVGEHFEAVQILATRTVEGATHYIFKGVGNWHARMGMAAEFVNGEVAKENAQQIAEHLKPEE